MPKNLMLPRTSLDTTQLPTIADAQHVRTLRPAGSSSAGPTYNIGRGMGGKGLGKSGSVRHRLISRNNLMGITKPAIRRLARRGGVKRLSQGVYEAIRHTLKKFLQNVIHDTIVYTEHAQRKIITSLDVVYALKRQGRTLYGF
ncbi:Histone H4 [Rhizophlyctis rosea]|nr:Histone H4 [Rhizophlyctis rosea]